MSERSNLPPMDTAAMARLYSEIGSLNAKVDALIEVQQRILSKDDGISKRLGEVEKDLVKIKTYGTMLVIVVSTFGPILAKYIFKL